MLVLNRFLLRKMPLRDTGKTATPGERMAGFFNSFRIALVALAMPVMIVGGVVGGVFTPTESSVAAVLYAMAVGAIMRTVGMSAMARIILKASVVSAAIMLIVANANVLGWVLAFEQIPQAVAEFFLSLTTSPEVFLVLVMVLLLLVGLFLETSGAIIILTPVLLPAAEQFGFDSLHFGIVMVFGLVIGLITPPVGLCLFVACGIGNVSLHRLSVAVVPYVVLLVAVYAVFAFFPQAALWLPDLLMK
jgi:C4-dicarboxylate transporter DctM subunit